MKANKKILKILIPILIPVLLAGGLLAVWYFNREKPEDGKKDITISVVYQDGKTETHEVSTDAQYLKEAADTVLKLDGTESEYGFLITAINGVSADYDTDKAYWAIYVNDEYATLGVSAQPVADGDTYKFQYETAAE